MRKRFVAAAFLFVALATAMVFAIVWGVLDGNTHPNVGAIVYQVPGDPQIFPAASGTLISDRVFLTAGHVTTSLQRMIIGGVTTIDKIYICFDSTDTLLAGANLRPITSIFTLRDDDSVLTVSEGVLTTG